MLNQLVNELKKKVVIVNEKLRKSELEGMKSSSSLIQLREELADVNAKLAAVSAEKESLNVECEELAKERFRLASENTKLEKDKADWMNKALEDISGAGDLREENSVLKNKVASIECNLSQSVDNATYWKSQAMDKAKDLETVREWNEELTRKAESIEKDRKYWLGRYNESEENLKEMTKQKDAFEKKSKLLSAELVADKKAISDYIDEVKNLEEEIQKQKSLIRRQGNALKGLRLRNEELKEKLEEEKNKQWWKKVFRIEK